MADLINRDHAAQAIEAYLCSQCDHDTDRDPECIACPHLDGNEILKSAPAVTPWIACSERLPEKNERVIVAIYGSDMIIPNDGETLQEAIERGRKEGYATVAFLGSDGWYGADWFPLMIQPTYWMPKPDLPEPPKEV